MRNDITSRRSAVLDIWLEEEQVSESRMVGSGRYEREVLALRGRGAAGAV